MVTSLCCLFALLLGDAAASLTAQAVARFRARDMAAAVELFEQAGKVKPLSHGDRFTLAMARIALNQRESARRDLEALPPTVLNLYWLGRLDAIAGDHPASIETYKRALALDPEFWRAHDGIGLSHQAMRQFPQAEASFRKAMHFAKGQSPWPAYNLGAMFAELENFSEAGRLLTEALEIDPNFSKAHYQVGRIREKAGQLDQALASYQRAAASADYPEVFYALHRLLARRGDKAGADAALQTFQRLNAK